MSETPDNPTSGGKGLVIGLATALIVGIGAVPVSVAVLGAEDDEQLGTCTGPNSGQALTVIDGDLPTVDGFTSEQVSVAAVIMQAAESAGLGSQAQLIGLITAQQESTMGVNTQPTGTGNDAGLFQQRTTPGWYGTLDQVTDPAYAAEKFFLGHDITYAGAGSAGSTGYHLPGLVDLEGWKNMAPGDAAQAVQRSAHPDKYAAHVEDAQRLMTSLSGVTVNIDTSNAVCAGAGTTIAATGAVKTAIEQGRSLLGTPYEFGGGGTHGPDTGIDCSGFIQYMLAAVGVTDLPRTAQGQFDALSGSPVDPADIQPGDLIFYAKGRTGEVGSPSAISHVSMYAGDNKMIESTRYNGGTEPGVQEVAAEIEDGRGFVGIRRVPGLSTSDNA